MCMQQNMLKNQKVTVLVLRSSGTKKGNVKSPMYHSVHTGGGGGTISLCNGTDRWKGPNQSGREPWSVRLILEGFLVLQIKFERFVSIISLIIFYCTIINFFFWIYVQDVGLFVLKFINKLLYLGHEVEVQFGNIVLKQYGCSQVGRNRTHDNKTKYFTGLHNFKVVWKLQKTGIWSHFW